MALKVNFVCDKPHFKSLQLIVLLVVVIITFAHFQFIRLGYAIALIQV